MFENIGSFMLFSVGLGSMAAAVLESAEKSALDFWGRILIGLAACGIAMYVWYLKIQKEKRGE